MRVGEHRRTNRQGRRFPGVRRLLRHALAGSLGVVCVSAAAGAQEKDARTLAAKADQAFADHDYTTALEMYTAAQLLLPESPELAYNEGVARYMLGDYAGAREGFTRSLSTRSVELEARIKFNLGDTAYALALGRKSSPPEAIDLLKSAIAYFRDALELDPQDEDARMNIELAQRLIRDLVEKLKQEPKGQQGDDQQEQQQDDREQQQGDQQGGRQDGEQQPESDQQQQEQGEQQADDRMTPQEVEGVLQAVRDKERQRQRELARRRPVERVPVAKDW